MNADELIDESGYLDLVEWGETQKLDLEITRMEKALEEFKSK